MSSKIFTISPIKSLYTLESLSKNDTLIHKLNPLSKVIATFAFILVAVSFNRYNVAGPLYLFSYPFIFIAISELPMKNMLSRVIFSIPLCFFMGFTGLLINRVSALNIGDFSVSFGLLSFAVIVMRMLLTVFAVTILMATTPFPVLTKCLLWLHIPRVFVLVIEMCYRYLGIVFVEKQTGMSAYILRSNQKKGVLIKNSGSFVGTLFLKNIDRAKRVYLAMKLRGYQLDRKYIHEEKLKKRDLIFLLIIMIYLIIVRILGTL